MHQWPSNQLIGEIPVPFEKKQRFCHCSNCPEIIKCYGVDVSVENQRKTYNLLLEYAPGGNLEDLIKRAGGKLPEDEVRIYTYMILKGLAHIHDRNYVHCDIKPSNILVFPSSEKGKTNTLKIADFGLAKPKDEKVSKYWGTPLYASPESVAHGMSEAPRDIWALGCTIVEMISGETAWSLRYEEDELYYKIGYGDDLPCIPQNMSSVGKDFLRLCFERDPNKRPTANMLLSHDYIIRGRDYPLPPVIKTLQRPPWISGKGMFDREEGFGALLIRKYYLNRQSLAEKLLICLKDFQNLINRSWRSLNSSRYCL